MNWRHPESRTPPARLGDKWIAKGRQMNWRHPESRTPPARLGEMLWGETNELETSGEPDTTSQTGRQMNCYKGRQMNSKHPESRTPPARLGDKWIAIRKDKWIGDMQRTGHHQSDWETNGLLKGETNELEISGEPGTTSQTGRQMNCYKRRQMNWKHPESRTPPARLGGKWIATSENKWIGDMPRARHHQPDGEKNELL